MVTKSAIETLVKIVPTPLQETAQKTSKVSFSWAKLIGRIYEMNPLLCHCGKEMKIIKIVTNPNEIWHILKKIGWPTTASEFDEPQDLVEWEICQLVPGTADGFPEEYDPPYPSGPDPPNYHFDDNIDPPQGRDKLRSLRSLRSLSSLCPYRPYRR